MKTAHLCIAILGLGFSVVGCGGSDEEKGPVTVSVTSCSGTFTPCGGDVAGTWALSNVCVNGSVVDALNSQLAAYPTCANTFTVATMSSSGSVTYAGTNYTRTGSVQTTGTMKVTAACFAEQTGGTPLSGVSCSFYEQVVQAQSGMTASCSYDGTNCNCDTTSNDPIDDTGTYSISGSTLTESGGDSYAFCVSGRQMTQSGRVSGSSISGVAQLTK